MTSPDRPIAEEVARRADEIYDRDLQARLEPDHKGEFLVLDVDTGEYELDADVLVAFQRAEARRPGGAGVRFVIKVGFPTAVRLGRHFRVVGS